MAKTKPAKTLAILGRNRRTGRWRLAARSNVLALFGYCYLDMRQSFAEDDEILKMKVTILFGSATFLLPFGAEVRPSGMSVLAGSTVDVPEHDETSNLPTLDIEWTAILGRIRIITETVDDEADEHTNSADHRVEAAVETNAGAEAATGERPTPSPAATDSVQAADDVVQPSPVAAFADLGDDDEDDEHGAADDDAAGTAESENPAFADEEPAGGSRAEDQNETEADEAAVPA